MLGGGMVTISAGVLLFTSVQNQEQEAPHTLHVGGWGFQWGRVVFIAPQGYSNLQPFMSIVQARWVCHNNWGMP